MLETISPFFSNLYETTGWNFVVFYDKFEFARFIRGAQLSIQLIVPCLVFSVIIGIIGAWAQSSRHKVLRVVMDAYIQAFRNTPPIVQLLFFYFALGRFTPQVDAGGYFEPVVSAFGWAVLSLSVFGGAFNVEIFRSGIESVPSTTIEGAESLGFKKYQIYFYITLPLAFRICLPALTNNLVSLAKTTSLAYVIAVPEMTYTLNQVWSDNVNVPEMMILLFFFYVFFVSILSVGLRRLEKTIALPGFGR